MVSSEASPAHPTNATMYGGCALAAGDRALLQLEHYCRQIFSGVTSVTRCSRCTLLALLVMVGSEVTTCIQL